MATTSLEAIRRITIEAQEKGLADVAAKLDKVARAQEGVVASSTNVEKSSGSTEQAFKRVERSLDTNVVAYERYASAVKAVNDRLAQGGTTQQRAAELISLAEVRLRKATGTMEAFGKATVGATAGPARHELINLSRQLQDVGVGLAGGQGLFTIVAQQGPQIADVFMSSTTSVKEFASTAASAAGRFLAAWGPIAAVVAAIGTAAYAAMQATSEAREARIATGSGRGRFSDVRAGDVDRLSRAGAGGGVSLGESREGVLTGVREGLSGEVIQQANQQAQRLAATLGKDLPEAQKILAAALREGAAGAQELYTKFGLLDAASVEYIKNVQQGQGIEAARLAMLRLLPQSLTSAADATTVWGNAWANFKTNAELALKAIGDLKTQSEGFKNESGRASLGAIQGETPRAALNSSTRGPSEGAMQAQADAPQTKGLTEAADRYNAVTTAIQKMTQAQNDSLAVMSAVTVAERAAAVEAQTYNQVLEQTNNKELAAVQAGMARQNVLMQSDAQQKLVIASQQQQLAMGDQLIAAAGAQGAAGVRLRAGLQEELAIRQAGLDVNSQDSQARIANAQAIAQQSLAMQDASQAAQLTQQIQGQIQMIQLETQMMGANAAERAKAISLLQSEQQARQLEAQGFDKSAEAVRKYAQALAEAKSQQVQAQQTQAASQAQAGGGGSSGSYDRDFHNQQAAMLREMDALGAQMDAIGMSAGAAAEHIKLQDIENQALATDSAGAADALRSNARALAQMTGALADAREAEQRRTQAIQEAEQAAKEDEAAERSRADAIRAKSKQFQDTKFESTRRPSWQEAEAINAEAMARGESSLAQIPQLMKQSQQKQLSIASSTIRDQVQALQDQKDSVDDNTEALEDNISALEKETTKRREQLDKQISKLEKALNPSRPDPYAERNPDYFYRFGTQAFKENDPTQALLAAAEAERDQLDNQLDAMKEQLEQQRKSVELQQKAIDEQIKGYEAQAKAIDRASNLLSNGVDLSAQEVAGIKGIIAALQSFGDYARLQAANTNTAAEGVAQATRAAEAAVLSGVHIDATGLAVPGLTVPTGAGAQLPIGATSMYGYGFQKGVGGFSGMFASGGYIPAGSWGIAGESGPEVINRKRAIAGPAQVTPIGGGSRPIVVNQTFVSQGGARELRASRGEIAQRSTAEMRRSLGAR